MGCFQFANYRFQMGVTVMGFAEHFELSHHSYDYSLKMATVDSKVCNKYQGPKIVAPFHLLLVLKNLDDFKT